MPRALLLTLLFLSACVTPVAVAGDGDAVIVDDGPPDDVIATLTPVYYDGVPAYWWGGHWYFRGGGGWRYYRNAPGRVGAARGPYVAHRVNYGRPRAVGGRGRR